MLLSVVASRNHNNHDHINKWGRVEYYLKLPAELQSGDLMRFGVWNIPKKEVVADNISLELWATKP